jgi:negative regulator of replication initiation
MKTVEISDCVYNALLEQVQDFGESANDVIARLLVPLNREDKPSVKEVEESEIDTFCRKNSEVCRSAISRYLALLRYFHHKDAVKFKSIVPILKGRSRVYVMSTKAEILRHGNSIMPKLITGTDYYAVTNLSNSKKEVILVKFMTAWGSQEADIRRVRAFIDRAGA